MGNKNLIVFFIALIVSISLFSASINALNEDFYAYLGQEIISGCSCGVYSTNLVVKNTGTVTSNYQIFKSGSASQWATITEDSFVLAPGETKEQTIYINLPCDLEGNYNIIFNITTLFGKSKYVEQKLDVGSCKNIDLIAKDVFKESCPCSPVSYEFNIKNTGSYTETYLFDVSNYREYASFSESISTLSPGQSKDVFVYFNLPCNVYGLNNVDFIAEAKKSGFKALVPVQLKINSCYDFDATTNNINLCHDEKKNASLTIYNLANISNQFDISSDSKAITILNSSIFVGKKGSVIVPFFVDGEKANIGENNVTIKVFAVRGETEKNVPLTLNIERCNAISLSSEKLKDRISAGEQKIYKIKITNNGTKQNIYKLNLDGADWFKLSDYAVIVPPNSEREVNLIASIPLNASTEKRWVKITSTISNYTKYTSEINFEFEISSLEDAYKIEISPLDLNVRYGEDSIKLEIKNKGFKKGDYEVVVDGPSWISAPLKEFSLDVGEKKEIDLISNATEEISEDSYKTTFYVKIKGTDVAFTREFNVKLQSAPLYMKALLGIKWFLVNYWLYLAIVIAALIVLFLLIFFIRKTIKFIRERKKEIKEVKVKIEEEPLKLDVKRYYTKKNWVWKLFLIIILIVIIGSAIYFGYPLMKEKIKSEEEFKPLVEINRSAGLEGFENVVYIRGEGPIVIPVTIKNRAPTKVAYDINVNSSWISSDTEKLLLDINETKTINLTINPTKDIKDGNYNVVLDLRIAEKDLSYKESIELRIQRQRSLFKDLVPYILAGIILLCLLLILIRLTRKSAFDVVPEKSEIKLIKERKKYLKKILGVLIVLFILSSLAYYTYNNWPQTAKNENVLNIDFSTFENQTGSIAIYRGEKIIIPITFSNPFENKVNYVVKTAEDWIEATDDKVSLMPGESKSINITAQPNENVSDGDYEIKILGEIVNEDIKSEKTIILSLNKKKSEYIKKYPYLAAALIIIILISVLIFEFKSAKRKRIEMIESIRKEIDTNKDKKKGVKRKKIKI